MKYSIRFFLVTIALVIGISSLLTSCSDDEESVSRIEMLTKSTWNLQKFEVQYASIWIDAKTLSQGQTIDALEIKFNEDSSCNVKSIGDTTISVIGKWNFTSDEAGIILSGVEDLPMFQELPINSLVLKIETLSSSNLILSSIVPMTDVDLPIRLTFEAI